MEPEPLVTYLCVEQSCGLRLARIVNDNGRPVFSYQAANAMRIGRSNTWVDDEGYLDDDSWTLIARKEPLKKVDGRAVTCRRHGDWTLPRTVMLDHWTKARASDRMVVKLDASSPWKSPDLF